VTTIDLSAAGVFFGKDLPEILRKYAVVGIRVAAARGLATILTTIIPSRNPPPVDRGLYRAGWKVQSNDDGAEIYNDAAHAPFIEHGVRANNIKIGHALIGALTEWVVRKGIETDPKKARGVAWAIAMRAKSKDGFFNRDGKQGLGILKELEEDFIPKFLQEEVPKAMQQGANDTGRSSEIITL